MAAKDGSGPRPAAHGSKCCFLNSLETSPKLGICPPFIGPPASLPVFSWRTVSQHQNTMAAKDGSGPRPAAHGSKRCFLNSLETSSKLGLCPPFIGHLPACPCSLRGPCRSTKTPWQRRTDRARGRQPMVPNVAFWSPAPNLDFARPSSATCELARVLLEDRVAAQKHHGSEDGSGPRPAAHGSKRSFLNSLETSSELGLCPPFTDHLPACPCSLGDFACLLEDRVAAPKHHGSEGRIGPAVGSPWFQTKLASNLDFARPSSATCQLARVLLEDRVAAPKHRGSEGRIGPAGHGPHCLTLLSELPRN